MLKKVLLFILLMFAKILIAQNVIVISDLNNEKRSVIIQEGDIISFHYHNYSPHKKRIVTKHYKQVKVLSITDSLITVRPFLSKSSYPIDIESVTRIKREYVATQAAAGLSIGLAAMLIANASLKEETFFFPTLLGSAASLVFLYTWDSLLNPLKNIHPTHWKNKNKYNLKLIEFDKITINNPNSLY